MATTRSRLQLGLSLSWSAWVIIVAVLLVVIAAITLYVL